jgi:hypothetical protein
MQQFFFMIGQRLSAGVIQWTTKPKGSGHGQLARAPSELEPACKASCKKQTLCYFFNSCPRTFYLG